MVSVYKCVCVSKIIQSDPFTDRLIKRSRKTDHIFSQKKANNIKCNYINKTI